MHAGAVVDLGNVTGDTALQMAASKGHKNVLAILLRAGAQVNLQNCAASTALHLAVRAGYEDIGKALLEAGADPTTRNKHQERPLEHARNFLGPKGGGPSPRMVDILREHASRA